MNSSHLEDGRTVDLEVPSQLSDSNVVTSGSGAYDPQNRPVRSHADLDRAYEFLKQELFNGVLPPCLITVQRTRRAYGYYSHRRFVNIDNPAEVVDEIALNPIHFATQLTTKVLATLAHEMAHLWQHHFGEPSRARYHNREWARKMNEIGLGPSSTGAPGGKPTGECVSHYIREDGKFARACARYLESNTPVLFQDLAYRPIQGGENSGGVDDENGRVGSRMERADRERVRKAATKTRFSCSRCTQNAWASRNAKLLCGGEECDGEQMVP